MAKAKKPTSAGGLEHVDAVYTVFTKVLSDLIDTVGGLPSTNTAQREALREAAKRLYLALGSDDKKDGDDISKMSAEEEVKLLHIME